MKNVTLSADARLIDCAREKARAQHSTLNEEFRRWLNQYVGQDSRVEDALAVIRRIQSYADTGGRRFTRGEMNER